ncbi:MAG: hypothetical protein HQL54_07090 [Magnetococcales bacterium]|nr:hypothetical protein [Magnetococcales bacterium]
MTKKRDWKNIIRWTVASISGSLVLAIMLGGCWVLFNPPDILLPPKADDQHNMPIKQTIDQ